MPNILLLATAWGPKHGGINAFNMDFANALADYLKLSGRVFCAVLDASREDCERAKNVTLIPIGKNINSPSYDESWAHTVWEKLQERHPETVIDWWVGHDVTSAEAALKGPQVARHGRTAVIMHMNYADYTGYKHRSGAEAVRKERRQRDLFKRADKHFAVGPSLRDAMRGMVDGEVTMLVPGFADVPIRPADHRLTAITFGRMDRESDRIKQGALALAGFAGAVRRAHEMPGMPRLFRDNPQVRVIGISEEKGPEEQVLRRFAHEKAGRVINLLAQPFDEDRDALFDQLGQANIALMLSWHEGFGLTGWEAIAAEVPLIVSRQSGLCKLVHDGLEGLGDNCLRVIDVQGQEGDDDTSNFTPDDEAAARDAILDVASDLLGAQRRAKQLKQLLQNNLVCTWENTARQFCDALGLEPEPSTAPGPIVVPPDRGEATPSPPTPEPSDADPPPDTSPPPLIALPQRWPDAFIVEMPDSLMLLPESEVVDFHSYRHSLLNEVLDWALAPDQPIKLRLQAGEGGTGKTRLAIQACHRLEQDHGWRAGFLRDPENIETEFPKAIADGRDCFVVVDFAETRPSHVITLTRIALKAPTKGQVRLLLLARDGGDWWNRLADGAKDENDAPVAAILRSLSTKTGPYRLSEAPIESEARSTIFHEALAGFARAKKQEPPAVATPDLSADHFGKVFFIHLAALAALRGSTVTDDRELLNVALGHERAYWLRLLTEARLDEAWFTAFEQAVALLTLVGGTQSAKDAKTVIGRTPRLCGEPLNVKNQFFDLLRRLYRRDGGIPGLQPDLLGERLIADALARDDELIDAALEETNTPEQARSALTLLTRMARRDPAERRWLERALERHSIQRMQEAFDVALETGEPMPEVIATVLQSADPPTRRRLVKNLRPRLPEETVNLKGLAIDIAEQHVILLQAEKGDRKNWKAAKQLKDALEHLAQRHDAAERFKEAAEARKRALFYASRLSRSGKAADRATLGAAHANLAAALAEVGTFQEALRHAEEAEAIHRELAARQPDAHRANWARSLGNLGNHLSELGRYEEALATAERAEAIDRELAARQPDAHRADWGLSLGNLAEALLRSGRAGESVSPAERAVELFGMLAAPFANEDRVRLGWCSRVLAEALLENGDIHGALERARDADRILMLVFAERPAYACDQYGKALPVLARAELAANGPTPAVETLARGIERIAPYFEQRPAALRKVMNGLVQTLREIDPGAAARIVPAWATDKLAELAGHAKRATGSD